MENKKRGFANLDPAIQREIARRGGLKVSSNKEHMRTIGKLGGLTISRDREYMSMLGKLGAERSNAKRRERAVDSQHA